MKKALLISTIALFVCSIISISFNLKVDNEEGLQISHSFINEELNSGKIQNIYNCIKIQEELKEIQRYGDDSGQKAKAARILNVMNAIDAEFDFFLNLIDSKRKEIINSNNESQVIVQTKKIEVNKTFTFFNFNLLKNPKTAINLALVVDFDSRFITFRNKIINLTIKSNSYKKDTLSFSDPKLMGSSYNPELIKQIDLIKDDPAIEPDDKEFVAVLYKNLLLQKDFQKLYFGNNMLIHTLTNFDAFEIKLLNAKRMIYELLRSQLGGGEFIFNKYEAVVNLINEPKKGGIIELEVYFASYSDQNQMEAKAEGMLSSKTENGKTKITLKGTNTESMKLKGTSSIINKSGIPKSIPWEKTIYLK